MNVGPAVAATLVADLPELGTLDGKAVASLAGLAPHVRKSKPYPANKKGRLAAALGVQRPGGQAQAALARAGPGLPASWRST